MGTQHDALLPANDVKIQHRQQIIGQISNRDALPLVYTSSHTLMPSDAATLMALSGW
jgi:hypothetical protein